MAPAFAIAMLGAIESLLSATVADGMTDTRHDSDQELIGQRLANLPRPLVGGIVATRCSTIRWSFTAPTSVTPTPT